MLKEKGAPALVFLLIGGPITMIRLTDHICKGILRGMNTPKLILVLALMLSACVADNTTSNRQTKEIFVQAYCDRATECQINTQDDCFGYIITLLCENGDCEGVGNEESLDECLEEFYTLECTNPLYLPKSCNDFLDNK